MFPVVTKLPILPMYDDIFLLKNFKGSENDSNKLNFIFKKKNQINDAIKSMNFDQIKSCFNDPLTINYLNEVTYLNDILLENNQGISADMNLGQNNNLKITNKIQIFISEIILSRVSYSLGLIWAHRREFEEILLNQITKNDFDTEKFKKLKDTIYESCIRIHKLKKFYKEHFEPYLENLKNEFYLSYGFICVLNDIMECCLTFFVIFASLSSETINTVDMVLPQIKLNMNKINKMLPFLENSNFSMKIDFINYVLNIKDFYYLMYSYFLLMKYSINIKKAEFTEINYEQCVYDSYIISDFINKRINDMQTNISSYNSNFNNKLYGDFIISVHNNYLKDVADEAIKQYLAVKDKLRDYKTKTFNDLIADIKLKDDLVNKAIANKSGV